MDTEKSLAEADAWASEMAKEQDLIEILERAVSQQLLEHPQWRQPAHWLELAVSINELIDEGASTVIEDPDAFRKAWQLERGQALLQGPGALLGLAGYPAFDLSLIEGPQCYGSRLVFYVQRHVSRLPLKASISLDPPHLPAVYEPVPQPLTIPPQELQWRRA